MRPFAFFNPSRKRMRYQEREREWEKRNKLGMTFNGNRNLHGDMSVSEQMNINQTLWIPR